MPSLQRLNIQDPWDLTTFVVVAFNLLFLSYLFSFEGFKIDFTKTGSEHSKSANQRIVFYFALLIASLYKFMCMSIEALLFSDASCSDSHLCAFVRFSPDVIFITAYSILVTHWAQVSKSFSDLHDLIHISPLSISLFS
jgi:hypothetical protein